MSELEKYSIADLKRMIDFYSECSPWVLEDLAEDCKAELKKREEQYANLQSTKSKEG